MGVAIMLAIDAVANAGLGDQLLREDRCADVAALVAELRLRVNTTRLPALMWRGQCAVGSVRSAALFGGCFASHASIPFCRVNKS